MIKIKLQEKNFNRYLSILATSAAVLISLHSYAANVGDKNAALGPELPGTCLAANPEEVRTCIAAIGAGTSKNLKITTLISCQGPNACHFDLSVLGYRDAEHKVVIYGSADVTAGFWRQDDLSYSYFDLINVSQVEIRSLRFANGDLPGSSQDGLINIFDSNNISIRSCTFEKPKFAGIANRNVSAISVLDSQFYDSAIYGIWIMETYPSENYRISNNYFVGGLANAILYSGNNGEISRNYLSDNHRGQVFLPYGKSGGQLLIEAGTRNTQIFGNRIENGRILEPDDDNLSSGIEFAGFAIHNVIVHDNIIRNNDGYAAYLNWREPHNPAQQEHSSGIHFLNNTISSNKPSYQSPCQIAWDPTPGEYIPLLDQSCQVFRSRPRRH